jgi:ankyrin repeat protein
MDSTARNANLETKDISGRTLIALAAALCNGRREEFGRSLCQPGGQGQFCRTPIAWAAFKGRVDVVEDFAARNANLAAEDDKCGMTPIALAAAVGQWEAVKDLTVRNANLEAKGNMA